MQSPPPAAPSRSWRVLVPVPGDPGGPLLERIGAHPVVEMAAAAAASAPGVRFTVIAGEENAAWCAGLPPGHELVVAPRWRMLPRARLGALGAAGRLHAALACVAAAGGVGSPRRWDAVHAWGAAAALPAAALALAHGLPWVWTPDQPPVWPPPAEGGGSAGSSDPAREHADWAADWAADEADLLAAADRDHADAVRRRWAPAPPRLAVLPHGVLAGWEPRDAAAPAEPSQPGCPSPAAGPPPPVDPPPRMGLPLRAALLLGRGAEAGEVEAVLDAVAELRDEAPPCAPPVVPLELIAVGCRQTAAAAAFRAGARRRGLLRGIAWRDLDEERALRAPERAWGRLDAAVLAGKEPPPRRLVARLWRQGAGVLAPAGCAPPWTPPPDPAVWCAPRLEGAAVAAWLRRRRGEGPASAAACRAAWREMAARSSLAPEELAARLCAAYAAARATAAGLR